MPAQEQRPRGLTRPRAGSAVAATLHPHTPPHALRRRRQMVEQQLLSEEVSEDVRQRVMAEFEKRESDFTRLQRQRMSYDDFEPLTIIGRGAFGEVGGWGDAMLLGRGRPSRDRGRTTARSPAPRRRAHQGGGARCPGCVVLGGHVLTGASVHVRVPAGAHRARALHQPHPGHEEAAQERDAAPRPGARLHTLSLSLLLPSVRGVCGGGHPEPCL